MKISLTIPIKIVNIKMDIFTQLSIFSHIFFILVYFFKVKLEDLFKKIVTPTTQIEL